MVRPSRLFRSPTACLVDMNAGSDLINGAYLWVQWRREIQQLPTPMLRAAMKKLFFAFGVVPLVVHMGDWQKHYCLAWSKIQNLTVDIILGTKFIERCSRGICPLERKELPFHSPAVTILLWGNRSGRFANLQLEQLPDRTKNRIVVIGVKWAVMTPTET